MTSPASLPPFIDAGDLPPEAVDGASKAIRNYCGWHIAPRLLETFVINEARGRDIFIPSLRVHEITACTVDGVDLTEDELEALDWTSTGIIGRNAYWPAKRRSVSITVDHGYEFGDVPDLVALCADLAGRVASVPAGIVRQQVGQRLEEYERAMLGSDLTTLDLYRIVGC